MQPAVTVGANDDDDLDQEGRKFFHVEGEEMYGNINEIRKCFWSQEKRLAERAKKVMFPYTVGHFYTVLAMYMYMYIPFY